MRAFPFARSLFAIAFTLLLTFSGIGVGSMAAHAADQQTDMQHELNERLQRQGETSEDMGERIPPMVLNENHELNPMQYDPVDPAAIEITTDTPADRFIRATTPLLVALTLGALGLLVFAISQAVRKRMAAEIRLGE